MDAENRSVCPPRVSTTGYLFIYIRWTRISIPPTPFCRVACVVGKGTNARHECDYSLIIDINTMIVGLSLFKVGFFRFLLQVRRLFVLGLAVSEHRWAIVPSFSFSIVACPPLSPEFRKNRNTRWIRFRRFIAAILFFANKMKRKKGKNENTFPRQTWFFRQWRIPISIPPLPQLFRYPQ